MTRKRMYPFVRRVVLVLLLLAENAVTEEAPGSVGIIVTLRGGNPPYAFTGPRGRPAGFYVGITPAPAEATGAGMLKGPGRYGAIKTRWLGNPEQRGPARDTVLIYAAVAAGILFLFFLFALLVFWSRMLGTRVAKRTAPLRAEINRRKAAEEKFRQGEQKFRTLLAQLPVGVFEADPEFRGLYHNETWCEMVGLSDEEARDKGWAEALHPDDRERVLSAAAQAARAGQRFEMEYRFLKPDGSVLEVVGRAAPLRRADGTVYEYIGSIVDVTSLKETERALREREALIRATLNSLPVGVVIADADVRVIEANPAVERILHGPLPWATGLGDWSAMYTGRWPTTGERLGPEEWPLVRAILKGEVVTGVEVDFPCYDGVERPLLLWSAPITDEQGNITGGVVVFQDISEIRKAKDELQQALGSLKRAQAQLVQSEKLAVIGQLAAGIAHEINNPLSYLSNNLNVLRRDFRAIVDIFRLYGRAAAEDDPESRRHLLEEAQQLAGEADVDYIISNLDQVFDWSVEGADRIRRIVVDMRSFARVGEARRKEIDLHDAIDTTLRILAHRLKRKNITVEKEYGDLPLVSCMPDRLNQVLLNLIVNAIDAVPDGGLIRIATTADESTTRVAISDNGPGIPREKLQKIFEPFYTTKAGGTGLGLSISESILAEHGGRIDVESEEGKGATFIIVLPAHARWEKEASAAGKQPSPQ